MVCETELVNCQLGELLNFKFSLELEES